MEATESLSGSFPERSLALVEVEDVQLDVARLSTELLLLRQKVPWVPVVSRIVVEEPLPFDVVLRLGRVGVRAVLTAAEPVYESLRTRLTTQPHLVDDVIEWLQVRLRRPPWGALVQIREIMEQSEDYASVELLFEARNYTPTTVRYQFRASGIPSPRAWFQLSRALRIALQLQQSEESQLRFAVRLGYCDQSAIAQIMRRNFGLPASRVRHSLGWEWLIERWWRTWEVSQN